MDIDVFFKEVGKKLFDKEFFIGFTAEIVSFVLRLLVCILIYIVVMKILKKISSKKIAHKDIGNKTLNVFIKSVIGIGIHIIILTLCLLILGVKESSLLAFFGTLGIGIGLALKDNLSNFAGGIIILIFKTYTVGDEVSISSHVGTVHSIDIFSTIVRTADNDLVIVPNGNIVSNKIINYTQTPLRRLKIIVSIDYNNDIELARKVLEELMSSNPKILKRPEIFSHVEDYGSNSIDIALKGWCSNEDYWDVKYEILNSVKPALDKVNISIPFPQMDIHIKK